MCVNECLRVCCSFPERWYIAGPVCSVRSPLCRFHGKADLSGNILQLCRPRCEAKAALYASSIRLRDDVDVSATAAPAQRLVSQLKRLEVSGTAGDLTYPDPEVLQPSLNMHSPSRPPVETAACRRIRYRCSYGNAQHSCTYRNSGHARLRCLLMKACMQQ